jgi:hypothetical protein
MRFGLQMLLMTWVCGLGFWAASSVAYTSSADVQSLSVAPGIQPLTRQSLERALASAGDELRLTPWIALPTRGDDRDVPNASPVDDSLLVHILSPFMRVVVAATESRHQVRRLPPASIDELNNEGVLINISSGRSLNTDILNAICVRDADVILPINKRIMMATSDARKGSPRAQFNFPIGTFASTQSLRLFVFCRERTYELTLTSEQLAQLE